MLDHLSDDLRRLVDDGAPPITLDEVELRTLADESPPRRPRRLLAAVGVAAAVVAVGVAAASFTRDDGGTDLPVATNGRANCPPAVDADFQVFLRVQATAAQADAIRAAITGIPGATIAHEVPKEAAYEQFRCIFSDKPDLVNSITVDDLPASFLVRATDPAATRAALDMIDGVESVESVEAPVPSRRDCASLGRADLRAYLRVGSSDDAVATVHDLVDEMPGVEGVKVVSRKAALTHFRCAFADNPELRSSITADDLPPALLVRVKGKVEEVRDAIAAIPGVEEVSR